jgi:hypothetical protein
VHRLSIIPVGRLRMEAHPTYSAQCAIENNSDASIHSFATSIFIFAVLAEHVFHLNLLPTRTASTRAKSSCILAAERRVTGIPGNRDASDPGTEPVTHA